MVRLQAEIVGTVTHTTRRALGLLSVLAALLLGCSLPGATKESREYASEPSTSASSIGVSQIGSVTVSTIGSSTEASAAADLLTPVVGSDPSLLYVLETKSALFTNQIPRTRDFSRARVAFVGQVYSLPLETGRNSDYFGSLRPENFFEVVVTADREPLFSYSMWRDHSSGRWAWTTDGSLGPVGWARWRDAIGRRMQASSMQVRLLRTQDGVQWAAVRTSMGQQYVSPLDLGATPDRWVDHRLLQVGQVYPVDYAGRAEGR